MDGMKNVMMKKVLSSLQVRSELAMIEKQLNYDYKNPVPDDNEQSGARITNWGKQARRKAGLVNMKAWTHRTRLSHVKGQEGRAANHEMRELPASTIISSGMPDDVVFGEWHFDCPKVDEIWGYGVYAEEDIVWKIHPPQESDDVLWVEFKQVVVEGILRINWEMDEGWKNKPLRFSFRGRETGEGYHQTEDPYNFGSITFTSTHECKGIFHTEIDNKGWEFTGKKVSSNLSEFSVEECRALYAQEPSGGYGCKRYWEWNLDSQW
jgi:hypothetical protein